jgi:hypothetical protein
MIRLFALILTLVLFSHQASADSAPTCKSIDIGFCSFEPMIDDFIPDPTDGNWNYNYRELYRTSNQTTFSFEGVLELAGQEKKNLQGFVRMSNDNKCTCLSAVYFPTEAPSLIGEYRHSMTIPVRRH